MADDSSDDDKTESATPRRLEKAREEGQVPRSRELATFFILLGGILGLWGLGGLLYEQLSLLMEKAFLFDRQQIFDTASTLTYLWSMCEKALLAILPLFLLSVVLAIVGPSVIGGILISAKSLQPQLSRLNPLKGLQRMVSAQALAELGKAIAKSVLVGTVAFLFIKAHMSELLGLPRMPLQQALAHTLHLVAYQAVRRLLHAHVLVDKPTPKLLRRRYTVQQEFPAQGLHDSKAHALKTPPLIRVLHALHLYHEYAQPWLQRLSPPRKALSSYFPDTTRQRQNVLGWSQ